MCPYYMSLVHESRIQVGVLGGNSSTGYFGTVDIIAGDQMDENRDYPSADDRVLEVIFNPELPSGEPPEVYRPTLSNLYS